MRRIALLCLTAALGGCGYNTWWNAPFTTGNSPNTPLTDSTNVSRVMGHGAAATPLLPEAGDIWPGPLPPTPTLQDIERQSGLDRFGAPGVQRGSSVQPAAPLPQPGQPTQQAPGTYARPPAAPPPREPGGRTLQTPSGPGVTSGGSQRYQTLTTPGGGSAIVVPNGDGTSTVIHSDGRIETVPAPR
jgi:hypothetical protein